MRCALLVLILILFTSMANARVIEGQESWQGEVRLSENILVAPQGRLIIAPGTRVISSGSIEVSGVLQATDVRFSGQGWSGLVLKGTGSETWLKNCQVIGAKTGVTVVGGEPIITGLLLENNRIGIELRQKTKARIENSIFKKNSRVGLFVKDESSAVVRGNLFEQQGKFGAYIYRAEPQTFIDNRFIDNPTGLMISHFGSDPLIENNDFKHNQVGIKVDRAARPQLKANRFQGNRKAVELYRRSDPWIEMNLFQNNQQAIHISFSSYPLIRHNDFIANKMAIRLEFQSSEWERQKGSGARQQEIAGRGAFGGQKQAQVTEAQRRGQDLDGTVDARNNWWGVQETEALGALAANDNLDWLHDGRDQAMFEEAGQDYPLDTIRWAPFALKPFNSEVTK